MFGRPHGGQRCLPSNEFQPSLVGFHVTRIQKSALPVRVGELSCVCVPVFLMTAMFIPAVWFITLCSRRGQMLGRVCVSVRVAERSSFWTDCDRLVDFVVEASASRAEDPGFECRLRRDFSGSSHTNGLKISTPVAPGTGWPGVSIL